jgi:hypothetical protein
MDSKLIFKEFNKTYFDFLDYIKRYNKTGKYAIFYNKNYIVKKTNPKLIITLWNRRMHQPYYEKIKNGDVSFFMDSSFEEIDNPEVQGHIYYFKELYHLMPEENRLEFVGYVQKLTELCHSYFL